MTAEDFLIETLKEVVPDGSLKIERTEQYRELWMKEDYHYDLLGPQVLFLLYKLQSQGFTFEFTSLDTFKVKAPHYQGIENPHWSGDGWSCYLEDSQLDCLRRLQRSNSGSIL